MDVAYLLNVIKVDGDVVRFNTDIFAAVQRGLTDQQL